MWVVQRSSPSYQFQQPTKYIVTSRRIEHWFSKTRFSRLGRPLSVFLNLMVILIPCSNCIGQVSSRPCRTWQVNVGMRLHGTKVQLSSLKPLSSLKLMHTVVIPDSGNCVCLFACMCLCLCECVCERGEKWLFDCLKVIADTKEQSQTGVDNDTIWMRRLGRGKTGT